MPESAPKPALAPAPLTAPARDAGIERLVQQVSGRPHAMVGLARSLLEPRGLREAARALCREALCLAPADARLRAMAAPVLSRGVGSWYFSMVQDHARHALYDAALRQLVRPGMVVLDIGAGTGLFAMMAARAGAAHVIACERDPVVAEAARAVVAANGLADRITIHACASQSLPVGAMPATADLLVWDNLANNLFGAGCAETLADAQARLLAPGAPVVPARVEIMAALATDHAPHDRAMTTVAGFTLDAFNTLAPHGRMIAPECFTLRSEAVALFDVDCTATRFVAQDARATVTASPGTVHGVVQWLRFHLGHGATYDTSAPDAAAFGMQFHPVAPLTLDRPTPLVLAGGHDTREPWFWVERPA